MTEVTKSSHTAKSVALCATVMICWVLHLLVLFQSNRLIDLFFAPVMRDEFGGKILYACVYSAFYAAVLLLYIFRKRTYIPAAVIIFYEVLTLFLPVVYFGTKFGSTHAGFYLRSLFSDRLLFTIKSLVVILILAATLVLSFIRQKNVRIVLKIMVPVLAAAVIILEILHIASPEIQSEMLSFGSKVTISSICDILRFIPLCAVAVTVRERKQ